MPGGGVSWSWQGCAYHPGSALSVTATAIAPALSFVFRSSRLVATRSAGARGPVLGDSAGGLFGSRRTLSPGDGRDLAKRTAPAVAAFFDPPLAEALTSRPGLSDHALTPGAMASRVSAADLERARTWVGTACQAAMDDKDVALQVRDVRALGKVVEAAATIDRQLARHAAEHLAPMAGVKRLPSHTLAELGGNVAEVDAAA